MLGTLGSFSRICGYEPRAGVKYLLEIVDAKIEEESSDFVVFLSAPTGYGKSSCTLVIADALTRSPNALGERLIHVLPLRAIVEDLYHKASKKKCEEKLHALLSIGAQAMHLLDVDKSPYLMPRLVYTTIDSFVHNLFKRPIAELDRRYSHFDVPRYSIYSSVVVFDEAHLFSSETKLADEKLKEQHDRMLTAFTATIRALTEAHVPTIIMTATMPDRYIETLVRYCHGDPEIYIIEESGDFEKEEIIEGVISSRKVQRIRVKDEKFEEFAIRNNPILKGVIKEEELKKIVLGHLQQEGVKILIVRNTVRNAIRTFRELKEELKGKGIPVLMIHGKMTVGERLKAIKKIEEYENRSFRVLLIGTQVIEAGVDIDFDILISDATVFTSLTQRVGRIGRKERERPIQPSLYVIEGHGDSVYPKDFVDKTLNRLKEIKKEKIKLLWRVPTSMEKVQQQIISYKLILEKLYEEVDYSKLIKEDLSGALRDIDHYFVGLEAKVLQEKLCSFVRESGLIAVSAWKKDRESFGDNSEALKEGYRSLLAVSTFLLRKKWQDILRIDGDKVGVLIRKGNVLEVVMSQEVYEALTELSGRTPCALLRKVEWAIRRLRKDGALPLAVVLHPEVYSIGIGLSVE
mgnify:CR=1 FL=1